MAATNLESTKGDAIDILAEVSQNITGWSIRVELWDSTKPVALKVRKARA